ncbi:MAG: hypothetical protein EP297_12845 [Gammaproteobacteria bacterium]|nr:MAG: hypothetical protein EP297_12845 [Gammaproteobacteria bacterium]
MNANLFEPKYALYDSLEEMLAPETLSELLSKPITRVDFQSITDHGGVAGGKLSYVITNFGRLVLKQMSIKHDWIMFSSDDQHCRSVTLWQYGMLDQLHPNLEHKTLACGYENNTWVILMVDLSKHVFKGSEKITPEITPIFLDALAKTHATFWNDSRLHDPRLGLCNETQSC